MKKFWKSALVMGAVMLGSVSFAQIQEEENVTVTMELIPILQLNMNTPDQVDFVFDEIGEYIGGITKYGATILTVSSSVNWDLFASGTSQLHQTQAVNRWDAVYTNGTNVTAGPGATDTIPLTALELRQFPGEITAGAFVAGSDYSSAFSTVNATSSTNSIYVNVAGDPYTAPVDYADPTANNRYIAGGDDLTEYVVGGSYLTQSAVGTTGVQAAYYFIIDYRIVPGLPATFPLAVTGTTENDLDASVAGKYAAPGMYTMNVKYLLVANQ
jgi:hypothetical protein